MALRRCRSKEELADYVARKPLWDHPTPAPGLKSSLYPSASLQCRRSAPQVKFAGRRTSQVRRLSYCTMVSPPILRYLFALSEPGNGACLFRFWPCRIARPSPKRTISTTLPLKLAATGRRELKGQASRARPYRSLARPLQIAATVNRFSRRRTR